MSKILLIDDSLDLLHSMKALLEAHGHEVETASNPKDAFSVADTEYDFDVVVCDWDLGPGHANGGRTTIHLREDYLPDARFIIYSGLERGIPEGMEFFLKDNLIGLLDALEEN